MKIKCLIVDDEPLAVKLIENHIAKIDALEVVATANNALKAFEILTTQEVDLLFLDIKMPNITGIDFLKSLKNPPKTIFTTAYRDFALEGFELEVVDYLLKPVTFERFLKSLDKFLRENKLSVVKLEASTNKDNFVIVKSSGKNYRISLDEIVYVESIKDYVKIHKLDGTSITSKYKISDLEAQLPSQDFARIHRSFIINTNKISAFSSSDIEVNGFEIPIGASYKEQVDSLLSQLKNK